MQSLNIEHPPSRKHAALLKGPFVSCFLLILCILGSLVVLTATHKIYSILFGEQTAKQHFSTIAPLISVLLYLGPVQNAQEALRVNNCSKIPRGSLIAQAICNIISLVYGLKIDELPMWASNLFGLGCQLLWLAIYHMLNAHSSDIPVNWKEYSFSTSLWVFLGFYGLMFTAVEYVGLAAMGMNFFLVFVPLAGVREVLQSRNPDGLPFVYVCMLCFNSMVWALYGWYIQDDVVFLPSVVGYVIGVFELLVVAWCHRILPFDLGFLLTCFHAVEFGTVAGKVRWFYGKISGEKSFDKVSPD